MNRPEAKALGLERYNTGRPCKHGHFSDRRTNSGVCLGCEPLYWRRYAKNENTLAAQKRASIKHRAKIIERTRKWREANPGKRNTWDAAYRERNREKVRAANAKWREAVPDYFREYDKANKEQRRHHGRKQKARRKGAPGAHTAADVREIEKLQRGKCAYCRINLSGKFHVDHIRPLKLGGSNDRINLQILCRNCNVTKGARDPIDHVRTLGMLI